MVEYLLSQAYCTCPVRRKKVNHVLEAPRGHCTCGDSLRGGVSAQSSVLHLPRQEEKGNLKAFIRALQYDDIMMECPSVSHIVDLSVGPFALL